MKVTCTQQKLNQGLSICEKVIGRNLTLPILQNILFECDNRGFIKFSSTDLEIGIEVVIPAKIEEEGNLTIPCKIFSDFTKNLPDEKIQITADNKQMSINCGQYKSKIKIESSKEFPLIPKNKEDNCLIIKASDFCYALSSVINSVSSQDIKPEISGVYIKLKEEEIVLVGTDSFRLSEKKISVLKNSMGDRDFILPRKTCDVVMKIFENNAGDINICVEDNQIIFKNISGEESAGVKIRMISRLIDGQYPNYEAIIPQNFSTKICLVKDEFLKNIKIASVFSSKINDVNLSAHSKEGRLEISSKDQSFGDFSSTIKCDVDGENKDVVLNFLYLLDGLNSINSQEVCLSLNQPTTPVLLSSTGDKSFKYIIMPIKS